MLLKITVNVKELTISHLSGCELEIPQHDINLEVIYMKSIEY